MNELMGMPEINKIVGMSTSDATTHLENNGYTCRIISNNGTPLMVSADVNMRRVNVYVVNNIVVDIDKIG